jgi:hypothetical protein
MTGPRTALLVLSSATGLLLARGLDGLGLLPGVAESEEVRRAALHPGWNGLGLLGCVLLGSAAARLLRRSPRGALALLVGGQVLLVVGLEEAARELAGVPEPPGGETGLWVAAVAQLALSLLATSTALVVLRLVAPRVSRGAAAPARGPELPPYLLVLSCVVRGAHRGRAPPRVSLS